MNIKVLLFKWYLYLYAIDFISTMYYNTIKKGDLSMNTQKVVLITGASRGIGASAAKEFARNGYNVVINYFNSKEKALSLKKEIEENYSVKVLTIVLMFLKK